MMPNREAHYHYDPLNRLVNYAPFAQATTRRFYLNGRLATEIQDTEQRSIMQHDDQLLAQQQRQNGNAETRLLATDRQRSVLSMLNANPPCPLAYAPYGHRPLGNGLLSLLGFNGERSDPVTGHYLLGNGYRAFNPVLMRFNSPDSWSPFGKGGLNAYGYCAGDPVNYQDPTGHFFAAAKNVVNNLINMTMTGLGFAKSNTPAIDHIKRTGNITRLRRLENEIYMYEDTYKSEPRLNIVAHGARTSTGETVIALNKKPLSATQLHSMLIEQDVNLDNFKNIRTVVCFSGDGGEKSFIKELSKLTNKKVKGYSGFAYSNYAPQDFEKFFEFSKSTAPNQPYKLLDDHFRAQHRIYKTNPFSFSSNPINYLTYRFESIRTSP